MNTMRKILGLLVIVGLGWIPVSACGEPPPPDGSSTPQALGGLHVWTSTAGSCTASFSWTYATCDAVPPSGTDMPGCPGEYSASCGNSANHSTVAVGCIWTDGSGTHRCSSEYQIQ